MILRIGENIMNTAIIITIVVALLIMVMGTLIMLNLNLTRLSKTILRISEIRQESDKFTLQSKYSIKESRETMEYLVNQKLAEWQIYNLNRETENYMSQDNMIACVQYIISGIIREMTPAQKNILSVGYPMDTDEHMIESIKTKAKFAVLNYAIDQNTPKEQGEALKNINAFNLN